MSDRHPESTLNEDQLKQVEEAKQRTLNILSDALKKKDHLLVENPEDFSEDILGKRKIPLISLALVEDLFRELQKVTFTGSPDVKEKWYAFVYLESEDRTIYLCPPFWNKCEFFGTDSRPLGIIHEVCHFLGYGHSVTETKENGKKEYFRQRKLLPLSIYDIESAFARHMYHKGTYLFGSYRCCGERARDSVCDKSEMSDHLRTLKKNRNYSIRGFIKGWERIMKTKSTMTTTQNTPFTKKH